MEKIIKQDRLIIVDILRGIALLGILLAHFIFWHTGGPLPSHVYEKNYGPGSTVANFFHMIFIFGKFFAFFAFLFGVSFHLQMQSLEKQGIYASARFARRLFILLIIGLIHHFFWMGDILSIYATLGFTLLLFKRLNDRSLFITGIVLALALPNKVWDAVNFLFIHLESGDPFGNSGDRYYEVVRSGSLWDILQFNADQLAGKAQFQLLGGRASITIGFFLLGMWASRRKLFDGTLGSKPILKKLLKRSAALAGLMLLILLGVTISNELFDLGWQEDPIVGFVAGIFFDTFNASLVLVMIAGIAMLLYRERWARWLYPFNYIGKLALTSYLLQTVAGLILFYGIGFGLFMKTTPGWNYIIAFGVFFLQVLVAKWWLQRFEYGPVEWLWRSATVGKWQPFIKQKGVETTVLPSV